MESERKLIELKPESLEEWKSDGVPRIIRKNYYYLSGNKKQNKKEEEEFERCLRINAESNEGYVLGEGRFVAEERRGEEIFDIPVQYYKRIE